MTTLMFLFALFMLSTVLWKHRKKIAKRLPKQAKPVVLSVPQKTLVEAHDELHNDWLDKYKATIQKNCDHLYHNQSWYTCRICGQEEPWEDHDDCTCRRETVYTMGEEHPENVLQRRSPSCSVHGKDYKSMPVSDRKVGPFGGRLQDWIDEEPYSRSKELLKGRTWQTIELPTREGKH